MAKERQQFTQEQKIAVAESEEKLGVKEAASVAVVAANFALWWLQYIGHPKTFS